MDPQRTHTKHTAAAAAAEHFARDAVQQKSMLKVADKSYFFKLLTLATADRASEVSPVRVVPSTVPQRQWIFHSTTAALCGQADRPSLRQVGARNVSGFLLTED